MTPSDRLLQDIDAFFALRQFADDDAAFITRLRRLQHYQAQRLSHTHALLLSNSQTAPAVQFLLDEVYGGKDLRPVAHDIRRATRRAASLLPDKVMNTSATVMGATLITQQLDEALTTVLGAALDQPLSDSQYAAAYRQLGMAEQRQQQLTLIGQVGGLIERYIQSRLLLGSFRLLRKSVHAAGFGNLYDFLDQGFSALKPVPNLNTLMQDVAAREQLVSQRLFDQHPAPYSGDSTP